MPVLPELSRARLSIQAAPWGERTHATLGVRVVSWLLKPVRRVEQDVPLTAARWADIDCAVSHECDFTHRRKVDDKSFRAL